MDGMTPFDMRFHRTLIDILILNVKNSEGQDEYSKREHIFALYETDLARKATILSNTTFHAAINSSKKPAMTLER
jgi:hypothetical protein